ncbi:MULTISPECIES: helix-turn-helix domain-containing protein [Listeria]|uniref:helix-turn-helix domain-containing protein n=1 Tax=Listeria TaxID=1637 RepID=UPI00162473E5|nr:MULTISPECIES: helix-turn-helix transcriptional regulator [Listeria]EAG9591283.1 XRE family transcriptional regulator [Listeria monocytogenes]EAH1794655.1 XRE family transcriptional regulator [Listeria monocytogenes]EJA7861942.1 helix-turn-helix transcriptional regulator [Listeria monocytogenes]MBC1516832.1 helix-turn-helix transcriptional regulator [Listeria immobilis]MBF2642852.1 helix-turn-helix transcriptional regulator [Listeria seeligeri]
MLFKDRLKELRKKKGITQAQLGKKINVSNVSISGYENGNRFPDTETLEELASYFEVSTDYLLGRTNNANFEKNYWDLNEKDEKFVAYRLEKLISDLGESNEAIAFSKEDEIDEETRDLLVQSLENSLRLGKMMAKKKYTPKKYRNTEKKD